MPVPMGVLWPLQQPLMQNWVAAQSKLELQASAVVGHPPPIRPLILLMHAGWFSTVMLQKQFSLVLQGRLLKAQKSESTPSISHLLAHFPPTQSCPAGQPHSCVAVTVLRQTSEVGQQKALVPMPMQVCSGEQHAPLQVVDESTQLPLQQTVPPAQQVVMPVLGSLQMLPVAQQVVPLRHVLSEVQQTPPQGDVAQVQTPLIQVWPLGQAVLQLPQLLLSVLVFTHVVPHRVVPAGQVQVQEPVST
jgi:hypothetical protein